MIDPIEFAQLLMRLPSVTPEDVGAQACLIEALLALGFTVEKFKFGNVENFWARRGVASPVFAFAGHTDVVPPGPLAQWTTPPFEPTVRDGYLYGRGAADMKGNIACMLAACARFIAQRPDHGGSIAWLITGDEEGIARDGTVRVIEQLQKRGEQIDYCLVGEPSSSKHVGDTLKIGRRGSLSGRLTIRGKQGHIAYPHLANNPIHAALPALQTLTATTWDAGNADFQPTALQISNIHAGTGTSNVIPGELVVDFNFRYAPTVTAELLSARVEAILQAHQLDYGIDWHLSGLPFYTQRGTLVQACTRAIETITGKQPKLSTDGGTSDGRFIAPTGSEVVELGLCNATIHQIDENIKLEDLDKLTLIYQTILEQVLVRD